MVEEYSITLIRFCILWEGPFVLYLNINIINIYFVSDQIYIYIYIYIILLLRCAGQSILVAWPLNKRSELHHMISFRVYAIMSSGFL